MGKKFASLTDQQKASLKTAIANSKELEAYNRGDYAGGIGEAEARANLEKKGFTTEIKKAGQQNMLKPENDPKKKKTRLANNVQLTGNQGIIGSMLNLGGSKLLGG